MLKQIVCGILVLFSVVSYAAEHHLSSPVGRWETIDDASQKPKSVIKIWEKHGKLYGKIEKVFFYDANQKRPGFCTECTGDRQNKPIVGMTILWNLHQEGNDSLTWTGGNILDPKNGKTYNATMTLANQGKELEVRGYVGISLLGRTQTWVRVDEDL